MLAPSSATTADSAAGCKPGGIVGLEEHFATADVIEAWRALEPQWQDVALKPSTEGETARRLGEIAEERFAATDDTGVDVAVVAHRPGVQNLAPDEAAALQRASKRSFRRRCAQIRG